MLKLLRLCPAILLCLASVSVQAQFDDLFAPFDCREHADLFYNEPLEDIVIDFDSVVVAQEDAVSLEDTVNGWRHWSYNENFAFGKDRGAMHMISDLHALHPYFRDRIQELIAICHENGIELAIVETYRTHAKQHEYKTMGGQYTSSGAGRSKHQYGLAVDVVPIVNSVAVWDNKELWKKVGVTGERLGLRWGGRWRRPYDPGHFEWTGGLTSAQLIQGHLPTIPKCEELYPCMDDDVRLLRKYWKEWETSQGALTRR